MSDRDAFLQAIAAQPVDRTARLVYADFLEESGEPVEVARAEFIRAQVEAETVHPNSNRHAELVSRARELFATHWLDWWESVCDAVGLPLPQRPADGVRGWFARRFRKPPTNSRSRPHRMSRPGSELTTKSFSCLHSRSSRLCVTKSRRQLIRRKKSSRFSPIPFLKLTIDEFNMRILPNFRKWITKPSS